MNKLLIKLNPEVLLPFLAETDMGNKLMKYETLLDCWIMNLDTSIDGKMVFDVLFNMLHQGKALGLSKTIVIYLKENSLQNRSILDWFSASDEEYLYYYNILKEHYPELFVI